MIRILKNLDLYSPDPAGVNDMLIVGSQVVQISPKIELPRSLGAELIDFEGAVAIPGIIDAHVHIAGAGGEGGPATRTPEIMLSQLIRGGVTTVIGCLGTDGMTRSAESVLMKVKSLRAEGASAWMYTGAYQVPTPTILGDPGKDLALIEEVIGVGEIALSDHRSSHPTLDELIRLAAHARVGAMLGGKSGVVNIHMGDARDPFGPLVRAVENSELNYKQFYPTHCNRNEYIFEDAKTYGKKGWIDITTSSYPYFPEYEVKPSRAVAALLDAGVPLEHITMTSDANGSLPHFDAQGNLVRLEMGQPDSILQELGDMVREGIPLERAIRTVSQNVAKILKLHAKGELVAGKDADLVVLDSDLNARAVFMAGVPVMLQGRILKHGSYERPE